MLATAHHADCRFLPPTVDLHTNHHNRPDTDTTLSTFRISPGRRWVVGSGSRRLSVWPFGLNCHLDSGVARSPALHQERDRCGRYSRLEHTVDWRVFRTATNRGCGSGSDRASNRGSTGLEPRVGRRELTSLEATRTNRVDCISMNRRNQALRANPISASVVGEIRSCLRGLNDPALPLQISPRLRHRDCPNSRLHFGRRNGSNQPAE